MSAQTLPQSHGDPGQALTAAGLALWGPVLPLSAPADTVSLAPFLTLWSQKHQLFTENLVAQRCAFLRPQI